MLLLMRSIFFVVIAFFLSSCTCTTAPTGKIIIIDNAPEKKIQSSVYYRGKRPSSSADKTYLNNFWENSDARFLTLLLPPYAIHDEPIKEFVKKVNSADLTKYIETKEEHLFLKYDNDPSIKIIIDRQRRGIIVLEQFKRTARCFVYEVGPFSTNGHKFGQALNIDLPEDSKDIFSLNAKDIANIAKLNKGKKANITDFDADGSIWRTTYYYDDEYWQAHDMRHFIQEYYAGHPLTQENLKTINSCSYFKNSSGEEELIMEGFGNIKTKRFILSRKRKELIIVNDREASQTHTTLNFYTRRSGALIFGCSRETDDLPFEYSREKSAVSMMLNLN